MEAVALRIFILYPLLGYALAFVAMIVEGDVAIFIAGFLTQFGYFDPIVTFLVLYAGALFGDSLWYLLGVYFKYLPLFLNRWVERIAPPFDDHLINKTFRTIFISKFTYGLHRAFFVRAGMLDLSLKKFSTVDAIASVPWILIVGGLGYISAASSIYLKGYLHAAEILLLIALVLFITFQHYIGKLSKRKL